MTTKIYVTLDLPCTSEAASADSFVAFLSAASAPDPAVVVGGVGESIGEAYREPDLEPAPEAAEKYSSPPL